MSANAERTHALNRDVLLPKARSMLETTIAAYQTGQARMFEVIDARRAIQEIELQAIRSAADFARNHAMLDVIAAPWGPDEIATGLVTEEMNHE